MIKTILKFFHGMFTGGLIVQQFYIWFLLPVFTGLPSVTYWQAIGLNCFIYLFNKVKLTDLVLHKEHEKDDLVVYGEFLLPWLILFMGYATHLIIEFLK